MGILIGGAFNTRKLSAYCQKPNQTANIGQGNSGTKSEKWGLNAGNAHIPWWRVLELLHTALLFIYWRVTCYDPLNQRMGNIKEKQGKEKETDASDLESESFKRVEYKGEFYGELPYYIGIGVWSPSPSEESGELIVEGPLNYLESASIVCLLKDAIDELVILKYIIKAPAVVWDLKYKTLKEKYTRRLTPARIFPEIGTKPVLTSSIKLQRDRASIEAVFREVVKSLLENGSFSPLTNALESLRDSDLDDIQLIQDLKKNLAYMNEIRIKVEEKRKMDDLEEKERGELMYQLQDELDDILLKCEVEEKFVNKWENVRAAQNKLKLNNTESYFKDNTARFNMKIKMEKRVTNEIQTFLKACQAELEDELENWMARYDSEMERRENKILLLKYNRDQTEDRKNELKKMYEEKCREIDEWRRFSELRKLRAGASLIIQSWWRGMMVRKKLGPYKGKKQKEGKTKK